MLEVFFFLFFIESGYCCWIYYNLYLFGNIFWYNIFDFKIVSGNGVVDCGKFFIYKFFVVIFVDLFEYFK